MSITTHTSTIREYVKNHTKDELALFFEDQFVKKDAEIERLKARCEFLERGMEQAVDAGYIELHDECVSSLNNEPTSANDAPELYAWLKEKKNAN